MAAEDYIPQGLHSDDLEEYLSEGGGVPQKGFHPNPARRFLWRPLQPDDPRNHGKPWQASQDGQLRSKLRKGLPISIIAEQMGRTQHSIECRAKALGLDVAYLPSTEIKSKGLNVNHMHLITLLQEGYTTCDVTFHDTRPTTYTYKMPKDSGLVAGDRVVVFGGNELKVARIVEVHDEPQIDFEKPYALKWIVQKVDLTAYDEQVVREAAALDHLNKVKRKHDQEKMLNALFGSTEGINELKQLLNGPK